MNLVQQLLAPSTHLVPLSVPRTPTLRATLPPKGVEQLTDDFLKKDIHICLIDTKIKSNTKPLVDHFKRQRENAEFLNRFQSEYVPCVSACIEAMIGGDKDSFFKSLRRLTQGQLEFLRPMITDNTVGLFTADYDFHFGVKISGSGGGGYVLGFTDDVNKATQLLGGYEVIWL